ncbi:hypothetical protein C2I36_00480 [Rhodobacteraceae bacterium WD3A24]|nr:hypothetical protein C2I36_00480 [Rhodobacteraceae bacterium WD3A24]
MSRIIDYKVIHAVYTKADTDSLRDILSNHVKDYIAAGWQPHGQFAAETFGGVLVLMQPMVNYETDSAASDP